MNKKVAIFNYETQFKWLKEIYNQPGRFYHNSEHIEYMLENCPDSISQELFMAILFHDIVYVPGAKNNEEESAEYARKWLSANTCEDDTLDINKVCDLIMLTKNHDPKYLNDCSVVAGDEFWIVYLDLRPMIICNFKKMKENDKKLFKEFQQTSLDVYRKGREEFLLGFYNNFKDYLSDPDGFYSYIKNLSYETYNVGVYCGSFDPMHIGHMNIVEKAEKVFDKVIIGVGTNPDKPNRTNSFNARNLNREIRVYNTVFELFNLLKEKNPNDTFTFIRGLRNQYDLQQEETFRKWVSELSNNEINIIYFFCDREYDHISSSQLKSISKMGFDIEDYLV